MQHDHEYLIKNRDIRWDAYYMKMAFVVAEQSKCLRAKYGSVLVTADNRITSTGFNGKPAGSINDNICYREGLPDNTKSKEYCCIHSEVNCVMYADPLRRIGGTLYTNGIPCRDCSLVIAQSGIATLVYCAEYDTQEHKGNFDVEYYIKYGMKFELVPCRYINKVFSYL